MTLSIFSPFYSPRLKFVLDFLCNESLLCSYVLYQNKEEYLKASPPHFNYSTQKILTTEVFIPACELLREYTIKPQSIQLSTTDDLPAFFYQNIPGADLDFDLLAMTFYLLSRYEEYLPFNADIHHRFSADQSLAAQADFLDLPLVDLWLGRLRTILKTKYPESQLPSPKYSFLPTYDIDMAWAYLNKGGFRFFGAMTREVFKSGLNVIRERLKVKFGQQEDPYFTFDYMDKWHKKLQLQPIYFFLVGKNGPFDKNIPLQNVNFQKLLRRIHQSHPVGLHPSYQSCQNFQRLEEEKTALEKVLGESIIRSRQHFLKLSLPQTYQNLLRIGIKEDYTMGYAQQIGFRASTAFPFFWYDLSKEKITDLRIYPFAVMDVSLKQYLGLPPDEVMKKVQPLINVTQKVGGTFSILWHNNSLSEIQGWQGWRLVYEEILKAATDQLILDNSSES